MDKFWAIFKFEFKSRFNLNLIIFLITLAFAIMMVAFFDSVVASSEDILGYLESLGEGFLAAFASSAESFTRFEGFLMAEFGSFTMIIYGIFAAFIGSSALSKEIANRRIAHLLSQPVSRTTIYIAKYLAGIALMLISMVALTFTTYLFTELLVSHAHPGISFFIELYTSYFIFISLMYTIGFAAGMFISDGKAIGVGVMAVVSGLMFNFLEVVDGVPEAIKYLNINYYASIKSLSDGDGLQARVIVLVILTLIIALAGLWRFNTRDIHA